MKKVWGGENGDHPCRFLALTWNLISWVPVAKFHQNWGTINGWFDLQLIGGVPVEGSEWVGVVGWGEGQLVGEGHRVAWGGHDRPPPFGLLAIPRHLRQDRLTSGLLFEPHPIPLVLVGQLVLEDWGHAVSRPRSCVRRRQWGGGRRCYCRDQGGPFWEVR